MKFIELKLRGVWLIEPEIFADDRGEFFRTFCASEFAEHSIATTAVQGNISYNPRAETLRGFHYQKRPFEEAKTLMCVTGSVFDIVVDLRPKSPTFMQWVAVEFSAEDHRSLHVPAGCANAWMSTRANTTIHYYMSESFVPGSYSGIRYNDPAFNFSWPAEPKFISSKDLEFPDFDPAALT